MQITVNGESRTVPDTLTVAGLLRELDVNPDTVVVERNLEILNRENHESHILGDGDVLEIIQMVSGG